MKDAVLSIQQEIAKSRKRALELETKLAELPADAGPEITSLYGNLLAKEQKYQAKMTLALAPPPPKKLPVVRIAIVLLLLIYLIYLLVFA